ncbi:DUF4150 domain-containing protein [Corallococcus sp. M34]|uniref:PAAR-like domain-containing protein n=1 Tax=Citreicoccus inhibens TaxID=2849499 RepID=UPI001C2430C5|nr:PAAR-like domain-containing protein [Citreicoccus inhibens]MBU8894436.1 DUF4150 domain-containing protein [Citreicoccus inhibens]
MPKVSVNAPKTPVTEGSDGLAAATLPNMCKMPGPPAPFVPTPLPNIGKSGTEPKNYSKSVTIEGKKVAIRGATFGSVGDVASKGTGGGVVSANVEGPTRFAGPGSMDVKIEGKNVQLLGDPMLNNCGPSGSPANSATMMGVLQTSGRVTVVDGKEPCPLCEGQHGALEETQETKVDASALAAKLEAMVNARKGRRLVTMLGVVQCKCGKKYADQSAVTLREFSEAVTQLGWHAPEGSLSIDVPDVEGAVYAATRAQVLSFLVTHWGETQVGPIWDLAEARAKKSDNDRSRPAAYPPGTCAAQKTLALVLEAGAYPGGLTERWFHSKRKPTAAPIEFFDEGKGKVDEKRFEHDSTVPPCRSCELIIPLMLCPGDKKEETCSHKI